MTHGYQNIWYSCIKPKTQNSAKFNCANVSWRSIKKPYFLFFWIKSNWKHTCIQSCLHLVINVFKAIYNYPHSKDLFFCVHSHAFNSFIFTLSCENQKRSLILSDAVAETTEFGEAERLDSLILINAVPGISVVVRNLGHF